jgi:hypothetical protein
MNAYKWIIAGMIAGALVITGCNQQGGVDTASVEKAFSAAAPDLKVSADKVVTAVKAGDYATAMTELKTLGGNAKLTPEQQQAVKDLIAKVQAALTDAAAKVSGDASKSAGDMQKALPK